MSLLNDMYPYFKIIDSHLSNVDKYEYIGENFDKLSLVYNDIGEWIIKELIRNNKRLYKILLCAGINSEEQMSMFILEMYYLYVNECI